MWLFAGMCADMYCQGACLNESFAAARKMTFVVAGAGVRVMMADQV